MVTCSPARIWASNCKNTATQATKDCKWSNPHFQSETWCALLSRPAEWIKTSSHSHCDSPSNRSTSTASGRRSRPTPSSPPPKNAQEQPCSSVRSSKQQWRPPSSSSSIFPSPSQCPPSDPNISCFNYNHAKAIPRPQELQSHPLHALRAGVARESEAQQRVHRRGPRWQQILPVLLILWTPHEKGDSLQSAGGLGYEGSGLLPMAA